mmetsp:Transcript_52840/g.67754  ORF Transcript_52840/g.67754 Transcript_52840/m.67754 type:complete len:185 (-) Transcript_52840:251-805(-)
MSSAPYKIVLMGAGGVGKSALVIRLTTEQFVSSHDPTIEDQYHFPTVVDGEDASLDILDTAGQEEYSVMHDQWIREGHAFMILFSVDEESTFDNAFAMRKKIERAKDLDTFPMVLVGNKCDKPNREISTEQGAQKAAEMGCPYIETSAKSGINVKDAFDLLVREVRKECEPETVVARASCCVIA